ncbi:MAG: hypothetical protein AB1445_01395 [Bacillota bacterium]
MTTHSRYYHRVSTVSLHEPGHDRQDGADAGNAPAAGSDADACARAKPLKNPGLARAFSKAPATSVSRGRSKTVFTIHTLGKLTGNRGPSLPNQVRASVR